MVLNGVLSGAGVAIGISMDDNLKTSAAFTQNHQNHSKLFKTTQNHSKPFKTIQNHPKPFKTIKIIQNHRCLNGFGWFWVVLNGFEWF